MYLYLFNHIKVYLMSTTKDLIMHSVAQHTCRIPVDEAISAMSDLSSGAYKLLIYYYSKSTGWNFNDNAIADSIGVTARRLQELHKELKDKKYLLIVKGKINNYFVGRKAVMQWTDPDLLD